MLLIYFMSIYFIIWIPCSMCFESIIVRQTTPWIALRKFFTCYNSSKQWNMWVRRTFARLFFGILKALWVCPSKTSSWSREDMLRPTCGLVVYWIRNQLIVLFPRLCQNLFKSSDISNMYAHLIFWCRKDIHSSWPHANSLVVSSFFYYLTDANPDIGIGNISM